MAKKQFKAESKRLLDLMINSIYTHKEIFLREIISNASDACDKLCYQALTDDSVKLTRKDFKIDLSVNKDARTITVTDNGIGMDSEFAAKIFEPFARASDSRTSEIEGTGLGMTIALNIARMMNGTIDVQSTLGKGSAFKATVYLRPHQQIRSSKASAPAAGIDSLQEISCRGKQVLLVEDNELNLEIAVELLKYAGLNITTAKNGLEGLDKFKAAPPGTYALILMDIQMPVMNGLEAAKAIRALPVNDAQTVPIVAMTANAFPEDIAATLQAGMNEHLSKPIDLEQFHSILQKWCQ